MAYSYGEPNFKVSFSRPHCSHPVSDLRDADPQAAQPECAFLQGTDLLWFLRRDAVWSGASGPQVRRYVISEGGVQSYLTNLQACPCIPPTGCGQNYHKRCVVKIPNNCNRSNDATSRRSFTLQAPRSPSGSSQQSLVSTEDSTGRNDSSSSLVKRMSDLMNDIIKHWQPDRTFHIRYHKHIQCVWVRVSVCEWMCVCTTFKGGGSW